MPEYPSVSDTLLRLQAWMKDNAPGVAFRPPANPAAVENFAEKSGLTLPDALKQLLLTADGETQKSTGAFGNWRMLSINEIQAAWGWLRQLAEKGAFDGLIPEPSPYLSNLWWHPGWIPVVSSDTGDFYCVDSDRPEITRSGQVLLYCQAQPLRPLVASSLAAWLDRITRDLHAGIYTYDEVDGFNGEAFLWSSLEGKHLLDDIPGKLIVNEST